MRPLWIGLLAAVPLLALAGGHFVQAQQARDHSPPPSETMSLNFEEIKLVGVTPGEFLRISVFNADPAQDGLSNTTILTESGHTLFESGEILVPPLNTVHFDFDGDSRLLDEFREASGRVQLSVKVQFPWRRGAHPPDPGMPRAPAMVASAELVDTATGRTTVAVGGWSRDEKWFGPPSSARD